MHRILKVVTAPRHLHLPAGFTGPFNGTVLVAGVPWPRYKLVALLAGLATILVVVVLTASAAASVLAAAGVASVLGLLLRTLSQSGQ
ncbi:hypothetical protein MSP7336_03679 [Mycobacterium shimoidei]|uniref:Uncharacterized protein n=1 Tax=Mycobacterium shimoidei TaxID=29313 RepID=A0A375Z385_MYCSH|nr:hypothetical protein MSP7336_03679 [Mycobacterium shimoidei]